MIKLFVGLGNPGPDYDATRHNAGFWWIDALARDLKLSLVPERAYHGLVARANVHGQTIWLLEPQTFMNLESPETATQTDSTKLSVARYLQRNFPMLFHNALTTSTSLVPQDYSHPYRTTAFVRNENKST